MNTRLFIHLAFLFAFLNVKAQPPYVEKVVDICTPQSYLEPLGFTLKNGKFYISASQYYSIAYGTPPHEVYVGQGNGYLYNSDSLGNLSWGTGVLNTACNEYIPKGSNVVVNNNHIFLAGTVTTATNVSQNFHGVLYDCINNPTSSPPDYSLTKTSTNGTLKWMRCYGGYDYDNAHNMIESYNGSSIIIGGTIDVSNTGDYTSPVSELGGQDMWLVEADTADGSVIREKCLGTVGGDYLCDIINTHDNGYLVSGSTNCYGPNNDGDNILIKLDSLLNEEWRKILPTPGKDRGNMLLEDRLSGSIYWLVSTAETDSIFHTNLVPYPTTGDDYWDLNNWVVKLDKYGNIIWTQCIGTPYSESIINGHTNIIFNDHSEIVIATYSNQDSTDYTGQIDTRFIKLDTLGNILTEKNLPEFYFIDDIISLGNDRYVCLANMFNSNCYFSLVYLGNTVGLDEQISHPIKIYPNPAQDFVSIELPQKYTSAQLSIYNLTGQLISQKQLTQSTQPVLVSELGNGMYIFVIQNEHMVIGRQRVVVAR